MKTLFIVWFSITNGVATDSVKSRDFESMTECKTYAEAIMEDTRAVQYHCIEGYSLSKEK